MTRYSDFTVQDALALHRRDGVFGRRRTSLSRVATASGIDCLWAAAILFLNGWIYALPVSGPIPIWFTPIQVTRGVFVHEVILIGYAGWALLARQGRVALPRGRAASISALIATVGLLAMISAVWNVRPVKDVISAGRYFLLAAYFVAAISWMRKHGFTFVLRTFLLGELIAAVINLYYTAVYSDTYLGGLPMLLGHSGPGGYLGMSVILSAWLMLERKSTFDAVVSVATCIVAVAAVSISFSKLSMIMAALGIVAWIFVLCQDFNTRRARRWYVAIALLVTTIIGMHWSTTLHYIEGVRTYIDYKFRYIDRMSIVTRSQYFLITGEILVAHPLFGAGMGGFYDAEIKTDAYYSDRAVSENRELGREGQSHPESSFLYYTAGIGFPGFCVVMLLFVSCVTVMKHRLETRRFAGKATWVTLVLAYLVFGLTLPTLFNSTILYLPAAIAVAIPRTPGR